MALTRLWFYLSRHQRAYLWGFLLVCVGTALGLTTPWILRLAVDGLLQGVSTSTLGRYALILVIVTGAQGAIRYLQRTVVIGTARIVEAEIRNDYFAHLQRLEPAFFQHTHTGDLMARATNDVQAVQQLFGPGIMNVFNTTVTLAASLAFMLAIHVELTAEVVAILLLISALYRLLGREIHKRFQAVQEQFGVLSTRVQENLSGIRVVKAFAQEEAEVAAFERLNREFVRRNLSLAKVSGVLWPSMHAILQVAMVLLLWRGGVGVVQGQLSLGELVQFSGYLMMLSWPMIALGWVLNLFQQGLGAMARLEEVFARTPRIADPPDPLPEERFQGAIEFRDVTFGYDGAPVLKDVNLKIPAGSTVAIVGPTGAGKSTLVNLIPRLFDPSRGQVLIDGVDVRRIPLSTLRRQVGMVPQETFLFSDTLEENIAFGVEEAEEGKVKEAAAVAQIHGEIGELPQGYHTVVGERGITLSGGQRQRVAIARAVLKDPTVLILDDALSSVDTQTEEGILKGLEGFMRSRTTLLISHRISTVRNADLIVVLDEGRIVEQGTHEELLARGGLYAMLYRRQMLQEELEALG